MTKRDLSRVFRWLFPLAVLVLAQVATARADDPLAEPTLERDIQPLLKAHCVKCHGPIKPKGKLNLSGPRALARGGASGLAVEPGSPDDSALWDLVATGEMPPKPEEPLSADEQRLIRRWIEQGARGLPRSQAVDASGSPGADHWAFAALASTAPPAIENPAASRTAVDRFLIAAIEPRGIALAPEADRATLIRRLSFDLTGLPPSPEETKAFIADSRPDAYERLVERLLASPHYGERWGKFWLDAMGFTESNGYFSADSERPLAYRYRDYVIKRFNSDWPLDQIVREQLAGDELSGYRLGVEITPEIIDQLVATHFLRNGQDGTGESDGNPDEVKADKIAVMDGAVQIIGSSLLGLTVQCAKCHDHKFEPVTQKEYYQFHAILAPAFNLEKWSKPNERIVNAAESSLLGPWMAHELAVTVESARLKEALGPRVNDPPELKKQRQKALDKVLEPLNARRRPHPGQVAWVSDMGPEPVGAPLLLRGNPTTPGPIMEPGVPSFLADKDNPFLVSAARWFTRSIDGSPIGLRSLADPTGLATVGVAGSRPGEPDLAAPFRSRPGLHLR